MPGEARLPCGPPPPHPGPRGCTAQGHQGGRNQVVSKGIRGSEAWGTGLVLSTAISPLAMENGCS